jgi:hypothetical protein
MLQEHSQPDKATWLSGAGIDDSLRLWLMVTRGDWLIEDA